MQYLSTRNSSLKESFATILFQGLSKDGGLFLPHTWPSINMKQIKDQSYQEIAFLVIYPFVKESINEKDLKLILNRTFENFNHPKIAPIINIESNKFILELFYGPTLSFKDYAMQFLGNVFSHILNSSNKNLTILGATSGDTGSAAIEAFKGKKDVNVFILHPHNMVSSVQRRQMTTINDANIHNIALEGTFDDCQKIVKDLFLDVEIQSKTSLTAVNSINWARLIAQAVYYFWAYTQLDSEKISFIVPSGNFGNIFSARLAQYMGLPIDQLHLVTNANDILHRTITSGEMITETVKKTYSPSMDIQVSSNFERQIFESVRRNSNELKKIMEFFSNKGSYSLSSEVLQDLQSIYHSYSVSNDQTLETIKKFKNNYNYLADPHTATGLYVLDQKKSEYPIVSLACAHPAKFGDAIEKATGKKPIFPDQLKNVFDKEEKFIILDNNIEDIKKHILSYL